MLLLKLIILQLVWYLSIKHGQGHQAVALFAGVSLSLINFLIYKPKILFKNYIKVLVFFLVYGVLDLLGAKFLSLVDYNQTGVPLWILTLYPVFLCYYGDSLNFLAKQNRLIHIIFGVIGGPMSYLAGSKISALTPLSNYYFLYIAIVWGVFFPLSIKIYYRYINE